jgi:hypothetical protein
MFDTLDRTGTAEFPFKKQTVFRALCMALDNLKGMTVDSRDDLASRLVVKVGMSAFSWGEKVAITVTKNSENSSVVAVQSGAKTILGSATTHGKNRENVRKIISSTSQVLSEFGAQWEADLAEKEHTTERQSSDNASKSLADEIKKLADLRDEGILTEDEFLDQKRKLLAS